jgi:membrane-associated phospholipid phosphatase
MTHTEMTNRHGTSDFSAPGWLASNPLVGLAMLIAGGLLFGLLAFQVKTNGPLLQWDVPISTRLHAIAAQQTPGTNEIFTFGFFLGKEIIELIGVILVIYFLHKRFWPELGMVILGWSGAAILWIFLTRYFDRARPPDQLGIVVHQPSFPSGHTTQAILCFGMLAYFLVPKMPSLFWKWVIVLAAILTVLFIGFSRLYEGGHYLTDLLAGYGLGIAWAGLIYTLLETFVIRRRRE